MTLKALLARVVEERALEDLDVVWWVEERSSRNAGMADEALTLVSLPPVVALGIEDCIPGWRKRRPWGVSRMVWKWLVKGGENVAGCCLGSV